MTNKQRKDLVQFAKQLTKEGKHQAAMSVWELLKTRWGFAMLILALAPIVITYIIIEAF